MEKQICYLEEHKVRFEPVNNPAAREVLNLGEDNHPLWAFFDLAGNPRALIWRGDGPNFALEFVDLRTKRVSPGRNEVGQAF